MRKHALALVALAAVCDSSPPTPRVTPAVAVAQGRLRRRRRLVLGAGLREARRLDHHLLAALSRLPPSWRRRVQGLRSGKLHQVRISSAYT